MRSHYAPHRPPGRVVVSVGVSAAAGSVGGNGRAVEKEPLRHAVELRARRVPQAVANVVDGHARVGEGPLEIVSPPGVLEKRIRECQPIHRVGCGAAPRVQVGVKTQAFIDAALELEQDGVRIGAHGQVGGRRVGLDGASVAFDEANVRLLGHVAEDLSMVAVTVGRHPERRKRRHGRRRRWHRR